MTSKINSFVSSALVFGALALSVVASPVRAMAQNIPLASADIPFSFHVGSTVLPAGDYIFSQESRTVLKLSDHATGSRVFAAATPDDKKGPRKDGLIVFIHHGNQYFLSRVDVPNNTVTYKCRSDKQEKQLSRVMQTRNQTQVAVNAEPILSK